MSDVMLDLGSDRRRTSFTGNLNTKLYFAVSYLVSFIPNGKSIWTENLVLKIQMDYNRTADYTGTIYPTCNPSHGFYSFFSLSIEYLQFESIYRKHFLLSIL